MKFVILIIMFFGDPTYSGEDAVKVLERYGKPLTFNTLEECGKHIEENLEELKMFGKVVYPEAAAVKQILCIRAPKDPEA